jgi:hypothetical protein
MIINSQIKIFIISLGFMLAFSLGFGAYFFNVKTRANKPPSLTQPSILGLSVENPRDKMLAETLTPFKIQTESCGIIFISKRFSATLIAPIPVPDMITVEGIWTDI